ncbi:Bacteriophage lambda tail assembly protein I [compost metagenome]
MSESWIEVQPGGYLKKFGNHKFFVNTPAEAIKAMLMQVPGFDAAFRGAEKRGIQFAVRTEKRDITAVEELSMGKPKVLKLIPKYSGSKNGGFKFLAVAAIIAATVYTAGAAGVAGSGFLAAGSTSAAIATSIAVSFAIGGITQLLTPNPNGLSTTSDPDNRASYAFGGPVNTAAQGVPVPVFYGKREVGGAVISASIRAEDQQ